MNDKGNEKEDSVMPERLYTTKEMETEKENIPSRNNKEEMNG